MEQKEKQGHVGNLGDKSIEEVKDILRRQEILAQNKKFVLKLPDKGEKIMRFIERLKTELKQREKVDETADLFNKMALSAERARRSDVTGDDAEIGGTLKNIINTNTSDKMVVDERGDGDTGFQNSYERIIKKSDKKPQHRAKFFPNRTKSDHSVNEIKKELEERKSETKRDVVSLDQVVISDASQNDRDQSAPQQEEMELSGSSSLRLQPEDQGKYVDNQTINKENNSLLSPNRHKTLQDAGVDSKTCDSLKYRYDESLERSTYGPPVRHTGAQLLGLQDSIALLKEQTQRLEKLHAEQAAEKLANRLGVGLVNPEGSSLKIYREAGGVDSDEGSDDSNDEEDYPD